MNSDTITIGNGCGIHPWACVIRPGQEPRFVETKNLHLHPGLHALHYATGVLEGMQSAGAEAGHHHVLFLAEHWARLVNSAVGVGIFSEQTELPREHFQQALEVLAQLNWEHLGCDNKKKRYPMYFRPLIIEDNCELGVGSRRGWSCVIITRDKTPYLNAANDGVTLWAPGPEHFCRTDKRCGNPVAKTTGNYTLGYRWKNLAIGHGAHEVLQFNLDGTLAETTGSNLFLVMPDGHVLTPKLNGSILPGITRRHIMGLCGTFDIPMFEVEMNTQLVAEAHECFITGTWTGVAPVQRLLLGHPEPAMWRDFGQPGHITRLLMEQFEHLKRDATQLRGEKERGWYNRLTV